MRDLRLIGVHGDGEHLVVADGDGQEYRVRIDDQLRAAVRRDRPRLGQLQIEMDSTVRPREVQAMIRAGASSEEVAARTGWSMEKIARFEGPVLDERQHVASAAQRVRVRGQGSGSDETLGGRAASRLASRGVPEEAVLWDSSRDAEGQWSVTVTFAAGGKERTARWWFDRAGMSVVAANDEARWLSEADAAESAVPTPHRPTAVFDVEAQERREPDELMASMREAARGRRRGRRRPNHVEPPLPLEGDEAGTPLPTELPPGAKGVHPRDEDRAAAAAEPVEAVEPQDATGPQQSEQLLEVEPVVEPAEPVEPVVEDGGAPPADATAQADVLEDTTPEPVGEDADEEPETPEAETSRPETPEAETSRPETPRPEAPQPEAPAAAGPDEADAEVGASEDAETTPQPDPEPEPELAPEAPAPGPKSSGGRRKGRASVPSWDDVMFGAKRGE